MRIRNDRPRPGLPHNRQTKNWLISLNCVTADNRNARFLSLLDSPTQDFRKNFRRQCPVRKPDQRESC